MKGNNFQADERIPYTVTLKGARVSAGYTIKAAAEKIGVTPNTVSRWEHGVTAPDVITAKKLSILYGIPMNYIFFG